ncbi:hypothetical protein AVEN_45956-1 [Araneus ventricosus]|uniref:C3H1-type domain-containing protein n=1 Tax=Araneus ventricosus TaxID=182803 RepID=A0A4Y2GAN6_ARAVE|nr:hypothetical protein AVEN_45956-1 [Araneus ventricosus]
MGKQYYCDYCERSFADGAENRKKHLASVHHQKLRKAHYDMFKGHCEFGTSCKYSHLTADDILNLIEQANQEKLGAKAKRPRADPDINAWVQTKLLKMDQSSDNVPSCPAKPILPPVLSSIPNLPPSLIPCRPSEPLNIRKDAGNHWG